MFEAMFAAIKRIARITQRHLVALWDGQRSNPQALRYDTIVTIYQSHTRTTGITGDSKYGVVAACGWH